MTLFDEKINVPNQVITMGIQSILQAKKIVLIAVGESKAAAVNKLFKNKYNPL
jgi:glucosamine-6-phosphate deaminase